MLLWLHIFHSSDALDLDKVKVPKPKQHVMESGTLGNSINN